MNSPVPARRFLLVCFVTAMPLCGADFPGAEWTRATPQEAELDEPLLHQARDYALTAGGAGCIIRGGRIVLSWGDLAHRFDLKSTTKSFGSAALGLAIKDGKVRLHDKAQAHHPTFGTPPAENAQTGWIDEITLFHLASQTAGFDKPGGYVPLLFQPGTEWSYSDSGPNWLAECLTLAYGRDLDALMFERIFTPIGITRNDLVWRKNQYRPEMLNEIKRREFGAGINANVNAMARFGYLWLREGAWSGAQILPRDFVETARATSHALRGLPVRKSEEYGNAAAHYGLLWWNNGDETIEGVPIDTFWSWGLYDSLIVVMPSLDMVVARAGQSWTRTKGADHYEVLKPFLQPIAKAATAARAQTRAPLSARQPAARHRAGPVIERIDWAPADEIIRVAPGSDNWPITWGDDDALYTAYGDGVGFSNGEGKRKLSLGFAKIVGAPPTLEGSNIAAPSAEAFGDGARGRKASGLLMIDRVLYLLVRNCGNAQLAWSADHAVTWTWSDWKFATSFGCPTFLNFGRNYDGARDDYVYIYSPDAESAYERADRMVLARVPRGKICERAAYEFFLRVDESGAPLWTSDITRRGAVFENPGRCYRSHVTFNPGLNRYLWCQTGPGADPRFAGGLAIYDAPAPWGPWTCAFITEAWDVGPGESSNLPAKWISADGCTIHLVFSGNDSFSVRRGQVILRKPAATSFAR
ncbi:MAG TPA: serine hydrolase [Chthoniobacteraceae bacterium]|nr:serine hydrolase [Chthoniobacteraceae bacterium]